MIIVGLTGGIASGKSTVSRMLKALGAVILDADQLARAVVLPGKPAWREIVDWLGESILSPDGSLDRARLGEMVFADAAKRQKLNQIVHPRVFAALLKRTAQIRRTAPEAILVYDVPLLIETGLHRSVDLVLLVYVTPEIQLQWLCRRDKLSRAEAQKRIAAQTPLDEKKRYADYVINNSGTLRNTARQVKALWRYLTGLQPPSTGVPGRDGADK